MVNRVTISDIIPESDMLSWVMEDKVLINAPTGAGKSYFVITRLNDYAEITHNKILFLTNRKLLMKQIEEDIKLKPNITALSYHQLIEILKRGKFNIDRFKYVVADECHFFFSDSNFNAETDIALHYLINLKNNIAIFLSATCETFKEYMKVINKNIKLYILNNELVYENLYYYNSDETIIEMINNQPPEEKIIMFCNDATKALIMHKQMKSDSSFLCSENNSKFKFSDKNVRYQIVEDSKFDSRTLFTTKVLDNGINIKDEQLKHIIVDIYDFDTIQQCIGRKRIQNENDKPNIYIRKFKQNSIQSYLNQWNKIFEYGQYFLNSTPEDYINVHSRKNTNGLIYNIQEDKTVALKLNDALYYKLQSDIELAKQITDTNKQLTNKLGHLQILCDRYRIPISEFKCLDDIITTETFNEQLIKFIDIKMFKDEKNVFKKFIKANAIKTVDKNHKSLGVNTINGYFADNKIKYRVESIQETYGENKGKRYWKLFDMT